MNNRRAFFIVLTYLAVITACVVPTGLPTASAPVVTAPTVDTGRIAVMVAETVSVAITQTAQAQPTATLILAATATAQATSTATPTPAPTETAAATASPSQSTLTRQADGSTLFADDRAGYEIKLPAGWMAVRINEKEYQDALALKEASNIVVQQALLSVQSENPNVFRLLALDTQAAHIQNDFVTDMRFAFEEGKNISLSSDADLQAIAQKISASAAVFRFEVTSVKVVTLASGMQLGMIEAKASFTNPSGAEVGVYQKQVFFNAKTGTQSIIFTTVSDLKDTLLPAFDAMVEAIKVK